MTFQPPKSAPQFAFCLPLRWEKEAWGRNADNRWQSGPSVWVIMDTAVSHFALKCVSMSKSEFVCVYLYVNCSFLSCILCCFCVLTIKYHLNADFLVVHWKHLDVFVDLRWKKMFCISIVQADPSFYIVVLYLPLVVFL